MIDWYRKRAVRRRRGGADGASYAPLVLRWLFIVLVSVFTTLLVGAYTRIGAVVWTVRPGNGLHDADLAAGALAGAVAWFLTRPLSR
jgi:hypothetical protein